MQSDLNQLTVLHG